VIGVLDTSVFISLTDTKADETPEERKDPICLCKRRRQSRDTNKYSIGKGHRLSTKLIADNAGQHGSKHPHDKRKRVGQAYIYGTITNQVPLEMKTRIIAVQCCMNYTKYYHKPDPVPLEMKTRIIAVLTVLYFLIVYLVILSFEFMSPRLVLALVPN